MARKNVAESAQLRVAYQLNALLHTMRAIGYWEEQLCSAMHAIQSQRSVDTSMRKELLHLLQNLPTQTYETDRNAVLDALDAVVSTPLSGPARSTKSPAKSRKISPKRP